MDPVPDEKTPTSDISQTEMVHVDTLVCEADWADAPDSDLDLEEDLEKSKAPEIFNETQVFGESMGLLQLTQPEVVVLKQSFDMLTMALGNDKEAVGDALYGVLTGALVAVKEKFTTPRTLMAMRLFNGFRLMVDKCDDPEELKSLLDQSNRFSRVDLSGIFFLSTGKASKAVCSLRCNQCMQRPKSAVWEMSQTP